MEVLDTERMRRADEITIRGLGVPGLVLMENAGRLVAETLLDEVTGAADRRVVVLAGRGNNGGDGFVVARHLRQARVAVEVVLVGARRGDLAGDAAAMAGAWIGLGGPLLEIADEAAWTRRRPALGPADVVVDALFGIGLGRPLSGLPAVVVDAVNASGATVVAVDVPSGIDASASFVRGPAVRADLTVTFARPKPAHLLPPAEDLCGDVIVVDIGIPDRAVRETAPDLHWVTARDAAQLLPEREAADHKGRFGHVLVVGGSAGKAGAAALAGWSALRGGAGLATVAAPASVRAEVAGFAAELMTAGLPSSAAGVLARGSAAAALALAAECSVLALGPGLGKGSAVGAEIRRIVRESRVPVVLDADGLNAFAGAEYRRLRQHRSALVLTPHPGEAARLLGLKTAEVQGERLEVARRIAHENGAVCVLKGYRTIVATPDGIAFLNPTGNPGMASGGMGDVLTGLVAGLVAQQLEPVEAAVLGVYLHGLAADLAVEDDETEETLTAGSVLEFLPAAYRALADGDDEGDDARADPWPS